jgi:2-succinyl-5-enolpyruvyl-6-hydroxy-3-cyclohexene-1-carboxylate synthase
VGRLSANQALAVSVVERLRASGVRTFCVCPGGRNAPLVEAIDGLQAGLVTILSFFDERSAGFFALGRARRDGRPVAVVTTSGTAAAELLPAMVEAHYSSVPLMAVTADRPRPYRGSGAPQAIEQAGLFGVYAAPSVDVETPEELPDTLTVGGPAHINVCFAEPLLAGWAAAPESAPVPAAERTPSSDARPDAPFDGSARVEAFLADVRAPLVIVGGLEEPDDHSRVASFCQAIGAPVMAEASSGLRCADGLRLLRSGDAAARRGFERHAFDSVVRIGDVPSWRTWRDLDAARPVPVLSVSRKPWRGLTRGTHIRVPEGTALPLPAVPGVAANRDVQGLIEWDRRFMASTDRLVAALPASEPALVRRLSEVIPRGSFVYLGNSLPIREWNRFATFSDRGFVIGESRGANGIDGQVSSFLGWARPGVENWAVLGDLTALYDLSALWVLRHLDDLCLRIVVVNNGGGRIFHRMFRNPRFQNRHAITFGAWAEMWGAQHYEQLPPGSIGRAAVVELVPSEAETDAFWAGLDAEERR